ncbi:Rz1-like lysis system protein LysC [Budvicia aquatica]|uniref:Uncharacterized protein n=1 Tax=Budvicia aquatica TaxID=82979 RepID=A0A485A153_9GAMM|nr:hypothetical protein [Budvicia aquatica]VFS51239.1 Uncharacterised protein [Budvicia aquatica]
MKATVVCSDSGKRRRVIGVLGSVCLILSLASCASNEPPLPELIIPMPPESALVECEEPQFFGETWGEATEYIVALKRELRICSGRLDAVIKWRQVAKRKQ